MDRKQYRSAVVLYNSLTTDAQERNFERAFPGVIKSLIGPSPTRARLWTARERSDLHRHLKAQTRMHFLGREPIFLCKVARFLRAVRIWQRPNLPQ
jgi:hypothetical protein